MSFLASKALPVLSATLFFFGIAAYIDALRQIGWPEAEISSDIGNGAMLLSIAIMLFHIGGCLGSNSGG